MPMTCADQWLAFDKIVIAIFAAFGGYIGGLAGIRLRSPTRPE